MKNLPKSFSRSGENSLTNKWWKELGDKHLNKLIDRALQKNFTLKKAWNRLREARAVVTAESSNLYPGLDVTGNRTVQERETPQSASSQTTTTDRLQAVASYEVDLWNRIESSVEAARYAKKASRAQVHSAAISVSSEVAITWYQLVDAYNQIRILKDQLRVNRDFYQIIFNRYEYGQSQLADVLRQRRLKQSTKERLLQVRSRAKTLENKLAVLLGQPPNKSVNPVVRDFPELPNLPKTGIPSRIINRRPDVKSAFYKVKKADRQVASAIANQYPRLNLTGAISTSGADAGTLFENWLRSIAADLTIPLIDAQKREAEVERAEAVLARRINEYKKSVLTAFREVENSIVEEKHQRKQLNEINKQLKSASRTVEILRNRYANGRTDFLSVLDAIRNKQKLQRNRATARRRLVIDRIRLYRSLSGGFSVNRPDTATNNSNQGA